MKFPRVSIAGLMAFVVLVAVGIAALKNPTELWASTLYTATLGLLLLSLIGVGFRQGNQQLHWAGFSVFGWGYFIHVLATSVLKPPALLTSLFIDYLQQQMRPATARWIIIMGTLDDSSHLFYQIGHSITVVLVALLGTILVRIFARQEDNPS